MGDPDLSSPRVDSGARHDLASRGLVVFPAPERSHRLPLAVRYAPFLITLAVGAAVIVAVVLVR